MKYFSKILLFVSVAALFFTACSKIDNLTKVDPLPLYQLGVSPVLSSSTATVAPTLTDTNSVAVTFLSVILSTLIITHK